MTKIKFNALMRHLSGYFRKTVERSVSHSERQMVIYGAIGFFSFPVLYYFWVYVVPQPYESLNLSLLASALCGLLMLCRSWPEKLKKYLQIYWYITIFTVLPFFFSFIFFKNGGSIISAMSMLIAVFLMIALLDWLNLIIFFIAGINLGWVFYVLTTSNPHLSITIWQFLVIYLFTIVAGTFYNFKTALLQQQRIEGMTAIISNVAHELRTPLLGLKSGVVGLARFTPALIQAYDKAQQQGIEIPKIRTQHFNNLLPTLQRMEYEIAYANTTIDILLTNIADRHIDRNTFELCSMTDCVNRALARYPFDSAEQEAKKQWDPSNDFTFIGSPLLMQNIIFNLLKNALHFIVQSEKGMIQIWLSQEKHCNKLHFKDTGEGINPDDLPHVFDRFYTTTLTGMGIGLSFCKMVMEEFEGEITCESKQGEFTEFVLSFPIKNEASRDL